MSTRCLTPVLTIADRRVRLVLRSRDAIGWLAVARDDDPQAVWQLLATCPESLVFALAGCETAKAGNLADLRAALISSDSSSPEASSSPQVPPAPAAADECSFDSQVKKELLRLLARLADEEGNDSAVDDIGSRLRAVQTHLVNMLAGACGVPDDALANWFEERNPGTDFWSQLALAGHSDETGVIELDRLLGPAADFEQRLQREKLASMKQLAYGASHEINNPLANIASRAQTLIMDETDPERKLRLAKINQQAFRAHEMIADMMLFAHPPQPEFAEADAVGIVKQVVDELQPLADGQNTRLEMESEPVPAGQLDKTQLAVAVKAIVTNSLESLRENGEISLRVACADDSVLEIRVSDSGPGIGPDVMRHLFDPFFSGREAGRGLGFGLSKAWRIAELHGGEILAESPAGGGARFCLRIPYRKVPRSAAEPIQPFG